jgi:hypothetical protein
VVVDAVELEAERAHAPQRQALGTLLLEPPLDGLDLVPLVLPTVVAAEEREELALLGAGVELAVADRVPVVPASAQTSPR